MKKDCAISLTQVQSKIVLKIDYISVQTKLLYSKKPGMYASCLNVENDNAIMFVLQGIDLYNFYIYFISFYIIFIFFAVNYRRG